MTASSAFMLALSMGGVRYPWASPAILSLFAIALLVGTGFIIRLRTAPEPLIPLAILGDREARLAVVANAFGWGPIVGLHIFLPIYLQNVVGMQPSTAGLSVLMLAVMLNISAGVTGTILPRREHYKTIPILGMLLAIASVLVLAWRAKNVTLLEFEVLLFLIGVGFGAMPPLAATALQNNVSIHTFGSAVATMQFSRNLYATMIVAVFGAIVLIGSGNADAGAVAHYSVEGFVRVFIAVAASFAVALAAVLLMKEKPLLTAHV
jgi:MFS family permease